MELVPRYDRAIHLAFKLRAPAAGHRIAGYLGSDVLGVTPFCFSNARDVNRRGMGAVAFAVRHAPIAHVIRAAKLQWDFVRNVPLLTNTNADIAKMADAAFFLENLDPYSGR